MTVVSRFLAFAVLSLPWVVMAETMTIDQAFKEGGNFKGSVEAGAAVRGGGGFTFDGQTYGVEDMKDMNKARGATGALENPTEATMGSSGTLDPTNALNVNEAGQHIINSFGTRPVFTIDPVSDPMITRSQAIELDPESVTGAIAVNYSGCSSITSSTPPVNELKICHESLTATTQRCQKIVNVAVKVEWVPTCTTGEVQATSAAGQYCSKQTGLDNWNGYHATAVCDYSKTGFQKITHSSLPIAEGQWGATGCNSAAPPNLSFMTNPVFWVPETITTVPTELYSSANKSIFYAGGCTGDSCAYAIMEEGQFAYAYPSCPAGTTDGAGLFIDKAVGDNLISTPITTVSPGVCFMQSPIPNGQCGSGAITAYQANPPGNALCLVQHSVRAPNAYKVTGVANTLTFAKSTTKKIVTETDSLDNQCAGLEAQAK